MRDKTLVIDANILIRAILGNQARQIIEIYVETTSFFIPETAYREAQEHLVTLTRKRGGDPEVSLRFLRSLGSLLEFIGREAYDDFQGEAKRRLAGRDWDDWPILASALTLGCAISTEDTDFFGCGVPIWTSDRVELFLRGVTPAPPPTV
ncbi:MAG: PIN domain-containing protein [Bryobacteraceae bacterium]